MRIGRGNRSTCRKPAPMLLCPPQIPHDLTRARTRAAAVGKQRLTAWAMTRPWIHLGVWKSYTTVEPSQASRDLPSFIKYEFCMWSLRIIASGWGFSQRRSALCTCNISIISKLLHIHINVIRCESYQHENLEITIEADFQLMSHNIVDLSSESRTI
jgi:hypothetical protein